MAVNPQTAALNPAALIAAGQRRSAFTPEVDKFLIVTLPGETMRCPVKRVIDDNTVIVQLATPPISRVHSFQFNDVVGVRRRAGLSGDFWEAQREADFLAEQKRLSEASQQSRPDAPKKVVRKRKAAG